MKKKLLLLVALFTFTGSMLAQNIENESNSYLSFFFSFSM